MKPRELYREYTQAADTLPDGVLTVCTMFEHGGDLRVVITSTCRPNHNGQWIAEEKMLPLFTMPPAAIRAAIAQHDDVVSKLRLPEDDPHVMEARRLLDLDASLPF